jgi:hypothetical protein
MLIRSFENKRRKKAALSDENPSAAGELSQRKRANILEMAQRVADNELLFLYNVRRPSSIGLERGGGGNQNQGQRQHHQQQQQTEEGELGATLHIGRFVRFP